MILAVFARGLEERPTGRGLVAREILSGLRRVRPDIRIHLFAAGNPEIADVTRHSARGEHPVGDLWRMVGGAAREIAELRPDVVWSATHLLPFGVPRRLPRVVTLLDAVWRDLPATMSLKNRVVSRLAEHSLTHASRVVCISEFTRGRLAHHWPHLRSRSSVMYLAPSSSLAAAVPVQIDGSGSIVANVGTLEPRKNLQTLLAAMAALPDATLIQCGSVGWRTSDVLRRARRMTNVRLTGYAQDGFLRALYERAAVAVFPSFYEGFHIPPVDAMALGCPVAASDIPVHREILGDAAVYFAPTDVRSLAETLHSLIQNPDEQARLSELGRARARRFSWDAAARTLADVLEDAARA